MYGIASAHGGRTPPTLLWLYLVRYFKAIIKFDLFVHAFLYLYMDVQVKPLIYSVTVHEFFYLKKCVQNVAEHTHMSSRNIKSQKSYLR